MNHIQYGSRGENMARDYLVHKGYEILDQNYKNSLGEIDIVAMDGLTLVFVEVKTRRSRAYGYAFEAVDERKQEKIRKTSLLYLQEKKLTYLQCRFDVVEVYTNEENPCHHFIDAFW